MKIQVGGLSEGVYQYRFEAKASDLALGENFPGDLAVDATLEKTGSQLYLKAEIRTTATFSCDRCVRPFARTLSPSYRMYYFWNDAAAGQFDPSEVQVLPVGATVVDISEDVRQTILLAVPYKLLCRDDCKGLCPQCGQNLNEGTCHCATTIPDGRWEKLRALHNGPQD